MLLVFAIVLSVVIVVFSKVRSQWPKATPPVLPRAKYYSGIKSAAPTPMSPNQEADKRVPKILEQVMAPVQVLSARSAKRGVVDLSLVTRMVSRGTDVWGEVEIGLIRRAGDLGYLLYFREGRRGLEAVLVRVEDGWANQLSNM